MSVDVYASIPAGTEPDTHLTPYTNAVGIPVIDLMPQLKVQFSPTDPEAAIRYLRQLAAVATDLADQVQDRVARAVLEG